MQSMPGVQGVASGGALSAGTMVVFGAAFALYHLTSLVLGPVNSRQLDLSLRVPVVEVQDLSEPLTPNATVVVGTRAIPAAPASGVARIAVSTRAASTPTRSAFSPAAPTVLPKPEPGPVAKPEPTAAPKPESDQDASNHHDNH
jgi:hypothetical protein